MRTNLCFFVFFLLMSCTSNSFWRLETIASDKEFSLNKLTYQSTPSAPFTLEFFRMGENETLCITFLHTRIEETPILLQLRDETGPLWQQNLTPFEGGSRIYLPNDAMSLVEELLQEGKEISILVGKASQRIDPKMFASLHAKWKGEGFSFQNLLKGPLE